MNNLETGKRKTVKGFMFLGMMLCLTAGVLAMESRSIGGVLFPEDCDELTDGCATGAGQIVTNQCTTSGSLVLAVCAKRNTGGGVFMDEFGEECEDLGGTYHETQLGDITEAVCLAL